MALLSSLHRSALRLHQLRAPAAPAAWPAAVAAAPCSGLLQAGHHLQARRQQAAAGAAEAEPLVRQDADAAQTFRQDRITSTGELLTHNLAASNSRQSPTLVRPPGLPDTAPLVPPITDAQLEQLAALVQSASNLLVLTGAGASTESNVPDYRGPKGAYSTGYKPTTHQQFMATPEARARYWARSFAGWHQFSGVRPNAAHEALARLQARGWVDALITQNVDRLHQKAGARDVLELHGTTHEVACTACGAISSRQDFQQQLAALNPAAAEAVERIIAAQRAAGVPVRAGDGSQNEAAVRRPDGEVEVPVRRPDGDVELRDAGRSFVVPPCARCGGALKPHIVFFGDTLPPARSARALELAQGCDAMLVVGSSLAVYSAFKLAKAAVERGAALALLTAGPTRADSLAQFRCGALAGEALSRLAAHPSLLVPRAR